MKHSWNTAARPQLLASATLLALACGSDATPPADQPAEPPAPEVVRETCDDNPLLAGCATPTASGAGPASAPAQPAAPDPDAPRASELELARAAAENVLRANCGQCHGPSLTPAAARAGMNYIEDLDQLVDEGKLIPLASADSPVVRRMRDGSMPPLGSNGPRPSERDIALVADFIDEPLFWPEFRPPASCEDQFISFDDLYREVQRDVRQEDSDDRPFLRYVTLTNRYNAGVCSDALDRERFAISKLVNMISTRARIEPPLAVDRERLIYRLDLRDYGWDREVQVDGQDFPDGWEAILAASPYAVPFVGDQADDIREDTLTDVPVMSADALLDVAALGELYYALIGVDVGEPLSELIRVQLDIDIEQNIADGDALRAGTTRSAISRQDRVVERHEIEVRRGAFWQSFDFAAGAGGGSIFADPFGFNQGGTEAIFSLPNGMLGFIIADENDNIVGESNILLDTFQNDFVARTSVSCSNCHAQGYNPVEDEVGPFVRENRFRFDRDDFEAVQELYVSPAELARVIEADSAAFRSALERAQVPTTGPDPVSSTFVRFNLDLELATAAGDLGLRPEELRRQLNLLDPALGVLRAATLDRDDFTAVYEESLCILQIVSRNQPDPERCADLLGN